MSRKTLFIIVPIAVLLLLGAAAVLYNKNHKLTGPGGTPIEEVVPSPSGTTPTPEGDCDVLPLSNPPWSDPLAEQMESQKGKAVIWTNANPKLSPAFQCFQQKYPKATASSVYRPPQYQEHLWEIRDRWCTAELKSNSQPGCAALKAAVKNEVCTHFGCDWGCGLVARSSGSAPHTKGTGIDIAGVDQGATAGDAAKCCLNWQNAPNDPWHYNLDTSCEPQKTAGQVNITLVPAKKIICTFEKSDLWSLQMPWDGSYICRGAITFDFHGLVFAEDRTLKLDIDPDPDYASFSDLEVRGNTPLNEAVFYYSTVGGDYFQKEEPPCPAKKLAGKLKLFEAVPDITRPFPMQYFDVSIPAACE